MSQYSVVFKPPQTGVSFLKVGDKIKMKNRLPIKRIQNKELVARLRRKKFVPYFVCISVDRQPDYCSINIKPYNF